MDTLSKALTDVRLRGSLLATLDFVAPWHVDFETAPAGAPTHYVVEGEAWLESAIAPPILLKKGDLVMLPRWDRHILSSPGDPVPLQTIRDVVRKGDGERWLPGDWLDSPLDINIPGTGQRTQMLSLVFELDESAPHPLLMGLPRLIHVRNEDLDMAPWLETVLAFLSSEATTRRAGYAVVSSRLADLLFMQIVRSQLLTRPGQVAGWLRALVDPAIGVALAAMHDDPGGGWSIARLAQCAGMSRSTFYERFQEMMDISPARYLNEVRMRAAAAQLLAGSRVKTVASDLGYATAFAFANAFKRHHGVTPGSYRTRQSATLTQDSGHRSFS